MTNKLHVELLDHTVHDFDYFAYQTRTRVYDGVLSVEERAGTGHSKFTKFPLCNVLRWWEDDQ